MFAGSGEEESADYNIKTMPIVYMFEYVSM